MGTVTSRTRRDGTVGYTAQIRLRRDGVAHTEAKTFDREGAAAAWIRKREKELDEPGAFARTQVDDPLFAHVVDRFVEEYAGVMGKTKRQVLGAIKRSALGLKRCRSIDSVAIVDYIHDLDVMPQTRGNYLSHLATVVEIARPAWGYPIDAQAVRDAKKVLAKLKLVSKSKKRDRRPTLAELDRIMTFFEERQRRYPKAARMCEVIAFAIFSTRRQEEITILARADHDREHSRQLVRDMKHPDSKDGNDTWCELTPEAERIMLAMPADGPLFFPYTTDAVGAAFSRCCALLGIDDLHFHDLRHDGISRLIEMGRTIPQAASVSGHRSWTSLQRYTHIRQAGDKYAGWPWLDIVAPAAEGRGAAAPTPPATPVASLP